MKQTFAAVGIMLVAFGIDEYYKPADLDFIPVKFVVGIICVLTALIITDRRE